MKPPKNSHPEDSDDDLRDVESLLAAIRNPTDVFIKKLEKVARRVPALSDLLAELQEHPLLDNHPGVAGVFSERLAKDYSAIVGGLDHVLVSVDSFAERLDEFIEIVEKINSRESPGDPGDPGDDDDENGTP